MNGKRITRLADPRSTDCSNTYSRVRVCCCLGRKQARPDGRATGSAEQGPQFGGAPNTRSAAY